jgi:iron-sulfur cluster assembly accessory protein
MTEITKDMIIGDVLQKYPDVAVIMLERGLHCVGCHANVYDTIEGGSKLHGLDDETIEKMVSDMNEFIKSEKPKAEPKGEAKVEVTDAAASKVKELQEKENQVGWGLRISVMPGGCSGFVYQMNFEENPEEEDNVLEIKEVKLFIDNDSLDMLRGAEIDYVDNLNESGFKINNPNAKQACGCGKSFG